MGMRRIGCIIYRVADKKAILFSRPVGIIFCFDPLSEISSPKSSPRDGGPGPHDTSSLSEQFRQLAPTAAQRPWKKWSTGKRTGSSNTARLKTGQPVRVEGKTGDLSRDPNAAMKLIDRFVGRELIVNVLFAIAVLSLVLVVGNIFRKLLPLLVNHDVPLEFLLPLSPTSCLFPSSSRFHGDC